MHWHRTSTTDQVPDDPVGEEVAATIAEILAGASVEMIYSPAGEPAPDVVDEPATGSATGPGPEGWQTTLVVRLQGDMAPALTPASAPLVEVLDALPAAGLRAAARFMTLAGSSERATFSPALCRALRDTIVVEALSRHRAMGDRADTSLIAATIEFLIELSGTRVESYDLTHGVVITDALRDTPRLEFAYPDSLRTVKRAPLLFDGQKSVLIVDRNGRARTELQRHRLSRLAPSPASRPALAEEFAQSGWLVAETTRRLGGIGLFLRGDRTIWVFADGQPLLIRRGEHWTAFPLELATAIADAIGGKPETADILVTAALIISVQRHGAILAIVEDADALVGVVSPKDRFDLRDAVDPDAMQAETRLHHLIDADELDAQTLARLASLDGATILDSAGHLLAYGAIVTSSDSQHEGARTAAAKTLSETAEIVLKISVDGDITVFRRGKVVATLLG